MKEFIIADEDSFDDISPIFIGDEECAASYQFGPAVRDYYLIHFCIDGRGTLSDKYGNHEIEGGEFFIIRPGEVTVYRADSENPWHYMWIAFSGKRAKNFDTGRSVYSYSEEIGGRLRALIDKGNTTPERYVAIIYDLMCEILSEEEEEKGAQDKLHKVRKYIKYNYMHPLRVDAISRTFGFERSYMFRIFKARYGLSIKDYITKTRMENAKKLLSAGYTVCETARMVGYDDEFNFSKAFKNYCGTSPSRFKPQAKN